MRDDHEAYDPYEQQDLSPDDQDAYDSMRQYPRHETPEPEQWLEQPEIISTSQAINLTCAMASISVLAALFFCFADRRSRAVRRYAIQSVGFGAVHAGFCVACWLVHALLGWAPYFGRFLSTMLMALVIAVTILALALRIVMMFHAYRGEAYSLPIFGESLRRFE